MVISAKHRLLLWLPCLMFSYLVLGTLEQRGMGGWVYRIRTNGFWCVLFLLTAATLISRGEKASFVLGIVFWLLSLAMLFLLSQSTLIVIHF